MKLINAFKAFDNYVKKTIHNRAVKKYELNKLKLNIEMNMKEYILIQEKKSILSRTNRDLVVKNIHTLIELGHIKVKEV